MMTSLDGLAVTRLFLERRFGVQHLGPVKSNTVLQTTRHRCGITSKRAVLPAGANDAKDPADCLLHVSVQHCYSLMKDLIRC